MVYIYLWMTEKDNCRKNQEKYNRNDQTKHFWIILKMSFWHII